MDFKSYIAEAISKATNINKDEIESYVEIQRMKQMEILLFHVLDLQKS